MPDIKVDVGKHLHPEDLEDPAHPVVESRDDADGPPPGAKDRGLDEVGLDAFLVDRPHDDPFEGEGPESERR